MLDGKIAFEARSLRFHSSRTGRGGPLCGRGCRQPGIYEAQAAALSKMRVDVDFLNEAHGRSIRSVACLNGARLEQSLEG
jgi:hypothetical protein